MFGCLGDLLVKTDQQKQEKQNISQNVWSSCSQDPGDGFTVHGVDSKSMLCFFGYDLVSTATAC